jgi:hypothetical protein
MKTNGKCLTQCSGFAISDKPESFEIEMRKARINSAKRNAEHIGIKTANIANIFRYSVMFTWYTRQALRLRVTFWMWFKLVK